AAYLFASTIRDNMLFGLKYRPQAAKSDTAGRRGEIFEAEASGNPLDDYSADWIDYEAAGAAGPEELGSVLLDVASTVGLENDLYHFGLRGRIDPSVRPDLAEAILHARDALRERLQEPKFKELVELYDVERF